MTVLDDIDQLYEAAVTSPESLNDQMIQDWTEGVAGNYDIDRLGAKYVRRCVTAARRLSAFWATWDPTLERPTEWPSRVDLALGVRAWRPQLDLAHHLLIEDRDPATYERAAHLFRVVHNQPFLDGMTFEVWLETPHS
ncbi:MAG: hypothetical protein M3112_07305 [Actinomycetia bacterium]|nr:hypothetical protein [Actinomycetes bacterium]